MKVLLFKFKRLCFFVITFMMILENDLYFFPEVFFRKWPVCELKVRCMRDAFSKSQVSTLLQSLFAKYTAYKSCRNRWTWATSGKIALKTLELFYLAILWWFHSDLKEISVRWGESQTMLWANGSSSSKKDNKLSAKLAKCYYNNFTLWTCGVNERRCILYGLQQTIKVSPRKKWEL